MGTVLRRPEFLRDLRSIWQFIASDSETRADGFVLELENATDCSPTIQASGLNSFPDTRRCGFSPTAAI
ncbi:type II toxin-antitoxin system RelE/ParE family toxin [Neorhizobium sp. NCHU2750]|uniref:type II toxin-antitoxin system RelE/ParE family toxin n=1 Tax=Neorhizobium sp. NCHU2750 TaxID=1825976 RepID=UPI0013C47264